MVKKRKLTPSQKQERFYRNRRVANRVIRGSIAKSRQTVHGARAINAQLPEFLRKRTRDYDVFVKNPTVAAKKLEKKLDKKFGGDFYKVRKGASKVVPVRKVVSTVTNEAIVDFTRPPRKIPTVLRQGVKYATLGYHKGQINRNLKDPAAQFRRDKDKEALQRIKLFEKLKGGS